MAFPQQTTQRLLDEQVMQKDPFEKLSQARAKKANSAPIEQVISESATASNTAKGNGLGNLVEGRSKVVSESPTLKQFLTKADPQAQGAFNESGLKKKLGTLGLGDLTEGLAFNEFGKMQLMLRLQEKFGAEFFKDPQARDAIVSFEQALAQSKDDSKENFNKMIASGERTLGILMGEK